MIQFKTSYSSTPHENKHTKTQQTSFLFFELQELIDGDSTQTPLQKSDALSKN
jgi:hypothetical protein